MTFKAQNSLKWLFGYDANLNRSKQRLRALFLFDFRRTGGHGKPGVGGSLQIGPFRPKVKRKQRIRVPRAGLQKFQTPHFLCILSSFFLLVHPTPLYAIVFPKSLSFWDLRTTLFMGGKLFYLQLELFHLQLSFFAYSPLRRFLDTFSHLKLLSIVSKEAPIVSKKASTQIVSKKRLPNHCKWKSSAVSRKLPIVSKKSCIQKSGRAPTGTKPSGPKETPWCRGATIAARRFLSLNCLAVALTVGVILKEEKLPSLVSERQFWQVYEGRSKSRWWQSKTGLWKEHPNDWIRKRERRN